MSTVRKIRGIDLSPVRQGLERAGWDVTASESSGELAARLDWAPVPGVWTLFVDRAGRFRFTATREVVPPDGQVLEAPLQTYQILRETQHILTVTGTLGSAHDLAEVLADLYGLAELEEQALTAITGYSSGQEGMPSGSV